MDDKVVHFPVESVGGVDFVKLTKDTGVQQVLFGSKKRGVWTDANLFQHMISLRNAKVDDAIKQALSSNDPMADQSTVVDLFKDAKRTKLFHDAKIDPIIEITVESFTTPDGKPIPEQVCRVMSTPAKNIAVHLEAIGSNFDWLVHAVRNHWEIGKKGSDEEEAKEFLQSFVSEFEYMVPKPVKVHVTDGNHVAVRVFYRLDQGAWKKKLRGCRKDHYEDLESYKSAILGVVGSIKKFFDENHVPFWDDEDGEDQVPEGYPPNDEIE